MGGRRVKQVRHAMRHHGKLRGDRVFHESLLREPRGAHCEGKLSKVRREQPNRAV